MALVRRRRDQIQALAHPERIRIMELFTRNPERTLKAKSLAADLAPDFPDVTVRAVAYHVAVLRDAQLLPASN